MEIKNTIKELKDLHELLVVKESKEKALKKLQNELNSNSNSKFNSLEKFDNNNKVKYILSQIGEKPVYIEPKLKLPNFVNRAKQEYQAKLKKYNEDYKNTEIAYYEFFKDIRNRLKNEDEFNKNECRNKARENYSKKEKELKLILSEIEKTKIIPKAYLNRNTISKIVTYFENNRVETMKEAINLFHEEIRLEEERKLAQKHREKIEKMIQDLRNDMDEIMEKVDSDLEDFEHRLSMFESDINSAYSKANEAYYKAEEAYSKANEAYWNSRSDY